MTAQPGPVPAGARAMAGLLVVAALSLVPPAVAAAPKPSLQIKKTEDAVVVTAGEKEILRYQTRRHEGSALPVDSVGYFHPLATPTGVMMTDVAPADHKHHRGVFLAWVEMHGKKDADFWGWGQPAPKDGRVIVNVGVSDLGGGKSARFTAHNQWRADSDVMVDEVLRVVVRAQGTAHVLDLTFALTADTDTRVARWAFGGFCLRTRRDGELQAVGPDGPVTLPVPGHLKPESDWPAAAWYGYNVKLAEGTAAAAIIDHPGNPPTLWHNVQGIRLLNPAITAPAELVLKAKLPLVLRYRVVVQDGGLVAAPMAALAKEWAATGPRPPRR